MSVTIKTPNEVFEVEEGLKYVSKEEYSQLTDEQKNEYVATDLDNPTLAKVLNDLYDKTTGALCPDDMVSIYGKSDLDNNCIKLKWEEPRDISVNNQIICRVDGVKVVRKTSLEDEGTEILNILASDFGKYKDTFYVDTNESFEEGATYYYQFMPYFGDIYNTSESNILAVKYIKERIYAFHIDGNESDPDSMITYLEDAEGMTPVSMDLDNIAFDYGDWEDAFFMPRPCMLKFDGTVDYYLNPNDYTKKYGTTTKSDVSNVNYNGNAMMEWGQNGYKIWYKIVPDEGDVSSATIYVANYQADEDYVAWSFMNANGELVDHFYTAIYGGYIDTNKKLRSISGVQISTGQYLSNYTDGVGKYESNAYSIDTFANHTLINILTMLIFKSTDIQTKLGSGCISSTPPNTGTLNSYGLFCGLNIFPLSNKLFGMENYYGSVSRYTAGWHVNGNKSSIKLTYGTQDGSTREGYTYYGKADGYIATGLTLPSSGCISKMVFAKNVMLPYSVENGSETTYYCDGVVTDENNGTNYIACMGGARTMAYQAGIFASQLNINAIAQNSCIATSLTCIPL